MDRKLLNLELYKKLCLIRKSEEAIIKYYSDNEMKCPMHISLGSEHISAGICQALKQTDQVMGSYRSHALYLSKTDDACGFFAELYGKEIGCVKGVGGSMHLCNLEKGHMGTSAIVASHIPEAIGLAFANKYKNNDNIVVVFFGDGAVDEGVFWESLNFAVLKRLPIIFVLEDNNLAVHMNKKSRQVYKDIDNIIIQYDIPVSRMIDTDAERVYNYILDAIQYVKENKKPFFMHFEYYRYLEHVGVNQDFNAGYRDEEEFKKWKLKDPIDLQKNKLFELECKDEIKKIEIDVSNRVENAIKLAKDSRFATLEEIYI